MTRMSKIIVEFDDGQKVELSVDGGTMNIEEGLHTEYDHSAYPANMEHNGNRRIKVEAFVGNPGFLDSETTPIGTRVFNREDR